MSNSNVQALYGAAKIVWHHDKMESLRKGIVTAPVCVRVKPTNRCDHRCFYCSYDPNVGNILSETIDRRNEIPKEKMVEILEDFRDIGVKGITFSGGGEPLVYPTIEDCFQRCIDYGIDLSIITNGQKLRGKKADLLTQAKWVRISLDSCTPEQFTLNRKIPEKMFYELKDNIADFVRAKSPDCAFGINFVVHHQNGGHIYQAAKLFRELGVDNMKLTPRWLEKGWREYHEPLKAQALEQIARARTDFGGKNFGILDTYENDFSLTGTPERKYTQCAIMQTVPVIAADQAVYFCHDKTHTTNGILGSIKDRSFRDLWFSPEATKIFKEFNPKVSCRHHCTYDERNILVDTAIKQYGPHINFP